MLVELLVENYAVVERVRVRFHKGLNVLTGETGSGKSIVVDALQLLFGGRASAELVRTGAARAHVAGIFAVAAGSETQRILEAAGIAVEDGEIAVEREIQANGKSRAFAGNRPVTVALLRELAAGLGDIHGQHDQQMLFSPASQLTMLDAFANSAVELAEAGRLYQAWRAAQQELNEMERTEQEKLRLADLWSFQRTEIEAAALKPGEDEALAEESRFLNNVTRIEAAARAAYEALYDAPESAVAGLRIAIRKLDEAARLDAKLAPVADILRPAEAMLQDGAHQLRDYLGRLEADPDRLEAVEQRLALLDKLKRKYAPAIESILAYLAEVTANLDAVENAEARRAALQSELSHLAAAYEAAALSLRRRRTEAARNLEARIEKELAGLAMDRTRFRVDLEPAPWSAQGADRVQFLASPNLGEELKALEKIASGGELSRVALALKTCTLVERSGDVPPTLVFDEVDAGIGGAVAETVGRRLKAIAGSNQVLCVTHLAQIAGFAEHHFRVEKVEKAGRTVAVVAELDGEERVKEVGRMLAGRLTPEALKHAAQLIGG
ncbi:MAG: DNA repair protein RecN [Acidobacteria bacterium]|nr:DNA repair protein RecN [Acidobacteriota bacterium]